MSEDLQINSKELSKGIALMKVTGSLDSRTDLQFEQAIQEFVDNESFRIVIDLSEVKFFGSTAMGTIFSFIKKTRQHNGNIVLLNPSPNVNKVFELLDITSMTVIANDLKEALVSFNDVPTGDIKGHMRLFKRPPMTNEAILMTNENNKGHLMPITKSSDNAFECIYAGSTPPAQNEVYNWIFDNRPNLTASINQVNSLSEEVHLVHISYEE